MSIVGDLFSVGSAIADAKAAKKKNAVVAQQYQDQKALVGQQTDAADYITQLSKALNAQGSSVTDAYGGGTAYDPVTGTWKTTLGAPQKAVQDASLDEELKRNTIDQAIRRSGLTDAERLRANAGVDTDAARRNLSNFQAGIGATDQGKLAAAIRLNRTAAVNAGYDDAGRAASAISLRTGAGAGDALSALARDRAKSIATSIGDPELEALQAADASNNTRLSNLSGLYSMFNTAGSKVNDAAFTPATYASTANDNAFKTQGLDLTRKDTALQGAGTAAAAIGSAANGLRAAATGSNAGTEYNITGKLLSGLGDSSDALISDIGSAIAGGAGDTGGFNLASLFKPKTAAPVNYVS